jgi:hypothetical protein
MKIIKIILILPVLSLSIYCYGQEQSKFNNDSLKFIIDLPVFDAPFNYQNGFYMPSMKQSIMASKTFYEVSFYGIDMVVNRIIKPERKFFNIMLKKFVQFGYIYVTIYIPLSYAWVHEEYHRAVMKNRGVNSYDDIYDFPFFSSLIAVSNVKDSDLSRMKNKYNPDFVRLSSAGYEGQNELILELQKDDFFYNMNSEKGLFYFINVFNNIGYLRLTTSSDADKVTDDINKIEGANISKRDFTGLDFTAWTYDLFRPNEAYEKRGIHPSGVGIDRYIKNSDLTQEEKDYLKKQSQLSFLSLIDPTLFGFEAFEIKKYNSEITKVNANIKHYLTSFGHSININLFFKKSELNLFVSILNQENYETYFPGLNVQVISYPVKLKEKQIFISSGLMLWLQPKEQNFKTSKSQLGGLFSIQVAYPLNRFLRITGEIEGKTKGWVASNVYLNENFSIRLTIAMYIR